MSSEGLEATEAEMEEVYDNLNEEMADADQELYD